MTKDPLFKSSKPYPLACFLLVIATLFHAALQAQTCPGSSTTTINNYANANTYYPGAQASVSAGATTLVLGNAATSGYGTTPISAWDIVLIIQMQGAQINSTNAAAYGDGSGTGSGYLNNAQLMAGQMEYAVATSAVPLTGGTLTVQSALTHSYKNAAYGTDGQYSYQVIRVPVCYNATLGANIIPPGWNGAAGGVFAIYVSYTLNMNGKTIDASSKGFRGGGGKNYSGSTSGANTDYANVPANKAGGSKGEGIAGTPFYLDSLNATALFNNGVEGYPGGSFDRGAPGNAGGGATDGLISTNSNNAGGGGGANGGTGGIGGNSWSSNLAVGGKPGALFAQETPSRLVMGGGGGAGSSDGGTGVPGSGFASSGAPGGGIVLITAGAITGTGTILANGAPPNTTLANDGSGGGGAGGSVLIITGAAAPGLTVNANGSAGASNTGGGAKHGPGGGGGGGIVYSNKTLGAVTVIAGAAGTTAGAVTYGAAAGTAGISSQTITTGQAPSFPLICNTLLAMESLSASATTGNGHITISWQVTTEKHMQAYTVERSPDGNSFSAIATLAPTPSADSYQYTDAQTGGRPGTCWYRIKGIDINGASLYSNIVRVNPSVPIVHAMVTPNPAAGSATFSFMSDRSTGISVRLIDMTGSTVWRQNYQAAAGMNTWQLPHLQELPNGLYLLQLNDGEKCEKIKLMIQH